MAILACVLASTSGFTRNVIGAIAPSDKATSFNTFNSASLSTLNCRIPFFIANAISSRVLPTPENTILSPDIPAALALKYSPPETTSIPAPKFPRIFKIAMFEFAFIA